MSLFRIIYISKSTELITDKLIKSIEISSAKNNKELDVTGILVATKTEFMQVLEGELENVNRVFMNICRDERHSDIQIISFDNISKRQFEDWSMKGIGLGLLGRIINQRLIAKYGKKDSDLDLPIDGRKAFALLYDVAYFLKSDEI